MIVDKKSFNIIGGKAMKMNGKGDIPQYHDAFPCGNSHYFRL